MAKLTSHTELKEYALRALGAPVINIEVDDTQLNDRIDDAVDFFTERHYSGVDQCYFVQTLSHNNLLNNSVQIDDAVRSVVEVLTEETGTAEVFDNVEYNLMDAFNRTMAQGYGTDLTSYYITKMHLSLMKDTFTVRKQFTHNEVTNTFQPIGWSLSSTTIYNKLPKLDDVSWTLNNSDITVDSVALPSGTVSGDKVASVDTATVFGMETIVDLKRYHTNSAFTLALTMKSEEYTGVVNVTVYDESGGVVSTKAFQPLTYYTEFVLKTTIKTKHMSKLTVKIESASPSTTSGDSFTVYNHKFYQNPHIILNGYRAVDGEVSEGLWNDNFIKRYTVQLFKRQWGENISKFEGMQMPGGITMNGGRLIQEAQEAITTLEEDFISRYELPIDLQIS